MSENGTYTQASKEAAAERLSKVREGGDWEAVDAAAITLMILFVQWGLEDEGIDLCAESEEVLTDYLTSYASDCWESSEMRELVPMLSGLRDAMNGDPEVFRQSVSWPTMWRAWRGAVEKLEHAA